MKKVGILVLALMLTACVGRAPSRPVPGAGRSAMVGTAHAAIPTDGDTYTRVLRYFEQGRPLPKPAFTLARSGVDGPVDYSRFGTFTGVGTNDYAYTVSDEEGLKKAVGEATYPDWDDAMNDPLYQKLQSEGKLGENHWKAFGSPDPALAFFNWTDAAEDPGVKSFFIGMILERAGLILPAIKSYYSVLVHFPRTACWSKDGQWCWYVAPAALGNIERLCRDYPQMGLDYESGKVEIDNGTDTDLDNDIIRVDPGRLVPRTLAERAAQRPDLSALRIVETRGRGRVQLVKFENGHWQLRRDGQPFFIRGITYAPTEIGMGPKKRPDFGRAWMATDRNKNGRCDAAWEAWLDVDGDGRQDEDEKAVGDFQLLSDMGINALRLFSGTVPGTTRYDTASLDKALLREMHAKYGIMVVMGDFLGAYTHASGASWEKGTDYTDAKQRRSMKECVRQMVLDLKDEPYILMWVLGNENNMKGDYTGVNATRTNAAAHPEAYAKFLDEVATMIHEIDPDHPVAVGNVEINLADDYAKHAPAIDIFGINAYRGGGGFGDLWKHVKRVFDRPVLITEFGCDAYAEGKGVDEEAQRAYHENAVRDIVFNQAGGRYAGNAIGFLIFEYLDEWWKDTHSGDAEDSHNKASQFDMAFPDGRSHEEWLGVLGQGEGRNSPFERQPRSVYRWYGSIFGPPAPR